MQKIAAAAFPATMLAVMLTMPTDAHAYLDAGTGSMILQLLLGGLAGIAIAGKLYWHKFLTAVGIRKTESLEAEPRARD